MMVAVLLLTYNRLEYAKRTLESAFVNLGSQISHVHLASDGDTDEYREALVKFVTGDLSFPSKNLTESNSERGGYGRNYNLATQILHENFSKHILVLEDDWQMLRKLELPEIFRDIRELGIGCARLGYLGYTQQLRGHLLYGASGHWMMFDPSSAEPHVFAGHPRIETVEWQRRVGPWPEGLSPGETEFSVAHKFEARQGVAWPLDVVKPRGDLFAHIGTKRSWESLA